MSDHASARLFTGVLSAIAVVLAPALARFVAAIRCGWQRRRDRRELRQRLRTEVERTDWLDAVVDSGRVCADGGRIVGGPPPRAVYDANLDRLDLLARQEVVALDAYYGALAVAEHRLDDYHAAGGGTKTGVECDLRTRIFPELAERRRTAERVLVDHNNR